MPAREWPWLKRDVATGRICGQFQVWKRHGDVNLRFDVHFGGYSVRHCRLAPVAVEEPGRTVLSPRANFPCLLGNASGDFLIRLKDVNDIAVVLRNGAHQQDFVQQTVLQLQLAPFWNALLEKVTDLVDLPDPTYRNIRQLRSDARSLQPVPFSPSRSARPRHGPAKLQP